MTDQPSSPINNQRITFPSQQLLLSADLSSKIPLQATVEFTFEFRNIYNVDLFDKGHYHVKACVLDRNNLSSDSSPTATPIAIATSSEKATDISSISSSIASGHASAPTVTSPTPSASNASTSVNSDPYNQYRSEAINVRKSTKHSDTNTISTDTVSIAYKREQVTLDEICLFRVHKLINAANIDKDVESWSVPFLFSLYWEEDNDYHQGESNAECKSQRVVNVTWSAKAGTHAYGIVTFEYGYAAALEFVVHGSLAAIHQPDKNTLLDFGYLQNPPQLEDILFTGMGGRMASQEQICSMDLKQLISLANTSHVKILKHLNDAYEVLSDFIKQDLKPTDKTSINFADKITVVSASTTINDALDRINMNLASVCSMLLERWIKVQDRIALSEELFSAYKDEYYRLRSERYEHGHIIIKNYLNPDVSNAAKVFDREVILNKMACCLRQSPYFNNMPPMPIKCQEIDPNKNMHVIIVEDQYNPDDEKPQSALAIQSNQQQNSEELLSFNDYLKSERDLETVQNSTSAMRLMTKPDDQDSSTNQSCLASKYDMSSNVMLVKVTKLINSPISSPDKSLRNSLDDITSSICFPHNSNPKANSSPNFPKLLQSTSASWSLATELNTPNITAYFPFRQVEISDPTHLVVCVHGLEGSSCDLRLFRSWIERTTLNSTQRYSWLMSSSNTDKSFEDIEVQGQRLAKEIQAHLELLRIQNRYPQKISFIGHSMGALIAKQAAGDNLLKNYRDIFHTYLSLSGPHLGLKYNPSFTHGAVIWLLQKFKKSQSLQQLQLKDNNDLPKNMPFLYKLLRNPAFAFFKHCVVVSSAGDKYVPFHSARMELSKEADADRSELALIHRESIRQVERTILSSKRKTNLIRYHIYCPTGNNQGTSSLENSFIQYTGRPAHVMTLENESFMEKFFITGGVKYFV